jgi:glycosyltransferase involved in cell wall biosynthesis
VQSQQRCNVAILLATHNGARFIEPQIRSLKENITPFTLHWLDDHSTDRTREAVIATALSSGIDLLEWHQPQHQGAWGAFFQLIECVEADIYLFCDQDDIWQPAKIDTIVETLLPDVKSPVLCFSDSLMFNDDEPGIFHSTSDVLGIKFPEALKKSRLFVSSCAFGHTQAFTRPLRDIFLGHKEIARTYAFGHDWWMYLLAVASGRCRRLTNVPTTLYRRHGSNTSDGYVRLKRNRISWTWQLQQMIRRGVARQAEGFILASGTLPPGAQLEEFVALARLVATLDRRQSPAALLRLVHRGAMWPDWRRTVRFAATCLCSDAKA